MIRMKKILLICFVLLLFAPLLQSVMPFVNLDSFATRDKLMKRSSALPTLRMNNIETFPLDFDNYWSDAFGFRDLLIRAANSVKFHLLHVSPNTRVLRGRDGWLFYADVDKQRFFQGKNRFSKAQLVSISNAFRNRKNFLDYLGIEYLIVAVPAKESVYPEYYPASIAKYKPTNRFDDLSRAMVGTPLLNLRHPLEEAKRTSGDLLYLPHDSHWNDFGAFIGYQAIIKELRARFPQLTPYPLNAFEMSHEEVIGDFSDMLAVLNPPRWTTTKFRIRNGDPDLVAAEQKRERERAAQRAAGAYSPFVITRQPAPDRLGKLIVYNNSFFSRLRQYLSLHFAETKTYSMNRNFRFDPFTLWQESPTVVIDQITDHQINLSRPQYEFLLRMPSLKVKLEKEASPAQGIPLTPDKNNYGGSFKGLKLRSFVLSIRYPASTAGAITVNLWAKDKPVNKIMLPVRKGDNHYYLALPNGPQALRFESILETPPSVTAY